MTFKFRMVSEVLSGKDAAADVRAALKKEVEVMKVRSVCLACNLMVGNKESYGALPSAYALHCGCTFSPYMYFMYRSMQVLK